MGLNLVNELVVDLIIIKWCDVNKGAEVARTWWRDMRWHVAWCHNMYMGNCWRSLLTEGNTAGVLVSGDSGTDRTLGYTEWKILYTSVYMDTEHCIYAIWWQYDMLYNN